MGGYDSLFGEARGIAVSEGNAWVADGRGGLQTIAVTEPSAPRRLNQVEGVYPGDVAIAGQYLSLVAGSRLFVLDVRDPAHPQRVGNELVVNVSTLCLTVSGPYACLGHLQGLELFDLRDPTRPEHIGSAGGFTARAVQVTDIAIYVAADKRGLLVYGLPDPRGPAAELTLTVVGRWPARRQGQTMSLATSNGLLCALAGSVGLQTFDVSNPQAPRQVGELRNVGFPLGLALAGNRAFFTAGSSAGWTGELVIADVADPARP